MRRPIWCRAYLIALEACDGNVSKASDFADISRRRVQIYRKLDAEFAADENRIIESKYAAAEARRTSEVAQLFRSA